MNVRKHLPAGGMYEKERPLAATRLDRHKRGLRAGRSLLAQDIGQLLDRCSLKNSRDRKLFAQLLLDDGEQAHRQQRVTSQLEEIVSDPDWTDAQNFLPDAREMALH